jgi:excisionase family DNA binding protein
MGELLYANFGRDSDPEMSKRQVAAYRRCSTKTVENWMTAGLPFHRDGRRAMFWRSDVDEWCEEIAADG